MATKRTRYAVNCDKMTTSERLAGEVRNGVVVYDTDEGCYYKVVDGGWIKDCNSADLNLGWAQYGDSNYTEASPLTISLGATEIIGVDGLSNTVKTQLPIGVTDLYDVSTSRITPASVGDYYSLSLQFNGKNSSNNGDATIFIDIGGAFTRLFPSTFRFNRGAGTAHEYYFTFNFYSLNTFLANGGLIKIESGTGNTEIYDIIIQIQKTHQGR